MIESSYVYIVDEQKMDSYLKNRFEWNVSLCVFFVIGSFSLVTFIMYREHHLDGAVSFLFSVPLIIVAFIFGTIRWNKKLRNFSGTEYFLTLDSIVQKSKNGSTKEYKYSEIAVIHRVKFGAKIIKGSLWTRINYYFMPKKSGYQLDDSMLIFIPTITSHYHELVKEIIEKRKQIQNL